MENPSNRHDLTDRQWEKLEPVIQKQLGKWGGSHANDTRTLINGVGWILRTRVAQKGAQYQGSHGCRCQWHACECNRHIGNNCGLHPGH